MHELEAAFACCLGPKDFAMYKVMMFFTGNAPEKFRVSEKTIMERCKISESGYKHARQKLVEMGWITHKPSQYIQVNFDKIYSDYEDYKQGCFEKTPAIKGTIANLTTPNGGFSDLKGSAQNSSKGFSQHPYNNINNNIDNNKIENKIGDKILLCENTPSALAQSATAPGALSQTLREEYYSSAEKKKATEDYYSWYSLSERPILRKYNNAQKSEDLLKMVNSEEYKALQKEAAEKRDELEQKYGQLFPKAGG